MPTNTEELDQLKHTVLTRADTQAEADLLFGHSPEARAAADRVLEGMFVQGKVSRRSNTSSSARDVVNVKGPEPKAEDFMGPVKKTAAIDAYVEKTAGVYLRYPELSKAAAAGTMSGSQKLTSKPKTTDTTGPTPAQSCLSGGAA